MIDGNDSDNDDHFKIVIMSHLDGPQATGLRAAGLGEEHIVARTERVGYQDGGVHSPNDIW